jgi:hypothetical protein
MQGVRLTASHTRSAEIRRLPRLHDVVQRFPILNSRFKHSIKSFVLALAAITIAAVLPLRHSCLAQSNILGTSAFDGGTLGYSISLSGESIVVSPVGYIASDGGTGHLIGRFTKSSEKELLKVTRVSDDTFAFSTVDSAGAESSNTIKLSRAVGNRYYLLTGFRLPKQRSDDVALVDISNDRYYWFIIENPAQSTIRERKSFYLGFQGDRIEHSFAKRGGLQFAAIRQTMNTPRTRIQLRSSSTGQTRVVRFRWTDPDGILIPTRLSLQSRRDIGLGLYSPAKKTLIIPSSRGEIKQLEVPALRCDGYQAITSVNSQGNISALELCPSGEFFLSERGNNASSEDRIVSSGPLPAPLNGARRADQTLVMADTGEAPVQIPAAGSNGSELLAPAPGAPTPVRNSWPTPTALPTVPPADTPTYTATATETPTEIPISVDPEFQGKVFLLGEASSARRIMLSGDCTILPTITGGSGSTTESVVCEDGRWSASLLYTQGSSGSRTVTASDTDSTATISITLASCPSNFVLVPGNSTIGINTTDFCLSKYEMRNDGSGNPISSATGEPWRNVSQISAYSECPTIGTGYHLATAAEWQTAALNSSTVGVNWTGGSPGAGALVRGHSDGSPGVVCDSVQEYVSTSVASGNCPSAEPTPTTSQRRTHYLTNGEVLWDMSGNLNEWVDWDNNKGIVHSGKAGATSSGKSKHDVNDETVYTALTGLDVYQALFRPADPSWNHANHRIGAICPSPDDGAQHPQQDLNDDRAVARGDNYGGNGGWAGLFSAWLQTNRTTPNFWIGFRCAWSP